MSTEAAAAGSGLNAIKSLKSGEDLNAEAPLVPVAPPGKPDEASPKKNLASTSSTVASEGEVKPAEEPQKEEAKPAEEPKKEEAKPAEEAKKPAAADVKAKAAKLLSEGFSSGALQKVLPAKAKAEEAAKPAEEPKKEEAKPAEEPKKEEAKPAEEPKKEEAKEEAKPDGEAAKAKAKKLLSEGFESGALEKAIKKKE